jgi:hypothetical protein
MKRFLVLASLLALAGGVFARPARPLPVSIVHAKVIRDFILRYDDVSEARWLPGRKGSTMYFVKDGFNNRAVYDLYGNWRYSMIFYQEAQLPKDIRRVVRREYFDLDITVVQEVQTEAGKAYFVHLEDQSNLKIVKVNTDGEMETIEEFQKI